MTAARTMSLRRRTHDLLEPGGHGDWASRAVDAVIIGLVLLNVVAVVVGSVAAIQARIGGFLRVVEVASVVVFTVEYLARLWSAPENPRYRGELRGRVRWALTPLALIDLLAVLPFYLPFLGVDLRFARALRLMRLLRLAKAVRYVRALSLLAAVVRNKKEELGITMGAVAILLVMSASLMFYAENSVQPEAFSSIPATMWWAVATLTTVGYGDVYPVTALGRLLGACVALLGIALFAFPTAILGSGLVEELERRSAGRTCPHCGGPL